MGYGAPATMYPTLDPAAERQALQAQEGALQADLDLIRKRLAAVEQDGG
jgi:hypothetical protein